MEKKITSFIEANTGVILEYSLTFLYAVVLLLAGWWLIKKATNVFENKLLSNHIDESLKGFLATLISVILKIVLLMSVIEMVGFKTTSFVALLGSAGLAFGLALSGTLQNFASGVLILFQKPFVVGDWVEAQGYLGAVKKIEIFRTILTTYDNKTIVIPNSELSNSSITNYSTEPTRLVEWVFGIGYDEDITLAKSVIEKEIFSDQRVKNQNEPFIKISSLGDSSVNIKVRAEVNQIDYWDVLFEYTEKIKLAFDQNKINIPYPQMQIHQSK